MKKQTQSLIMLALCAGAVSCMPSHLKKYRGDAPSPSRSTMKSSVPKQTTTTEAPRARPSTAKASIYALNKHTFRFDLREGEVWDSAIEVLMRNYNLTIVDRESGVVTTEWDSYYLQDVLFRNKVSVRIKRRTRNSVDVTIHNNVEQLKSNAQGMLGNVWVPATETAEERNRIVQNMALILRQPPPVLPPGTQIAKDMFGEVPRDKNQKY